MPDDHKHALPAHRFTLTPFDRIKPPGGSAYLVKRLIPREGLVVAWGPPKCGKSFWISDLALHVALGWEYRGRRVRNGLVVYVCLEGELGFSNRIEAFRRERLSEGDMDVPFYLLATRLDLAADAKQLAKEIREQIADHDCAIIIIDTLNRSLNGSESSDEDMSAYVKGADLMREAFRCAVVVVHHCGHDATRPRGHTSLLGAADAVIAVKRDAADQIVAELEYMKDGPTGEQVVSRLKVVELDNDEDGDPITSCVVEATEGTAQTERRDRPKLSGNTKIVFDMLGRAIGERGEYPPANSNIPPGFVAVNVETWRQFAYQGMVAESGDEKTTTQDAKSKAFRRAVKDLQTIEAVATWNDWVWKTSR